MFSSWWAVDIYENDSAIWKIKDYYIFSTPVKNPREERPRCNQGFPSFPSHHPPPERMDHPAANESLQKETIAFAASTEQNN